MQRCDRESSAMPYAVVFLKGDTGIAPPLDPIRESVEAAVGQVFNILPEDFGSVSRGPARVALARQVAMYLSHVACRLTLTEVGRLYARDRTTVAHACGVVEDLRDDARFDRVLDLVEMIVRFRLKTLKRGLGE